MLAAGALLPLAPHVRFTLIAIAAALIVAVLALRLRAHASARRSRRVSATYDRIERIRAERSKRRR